MRLIQDLHDRKLTGCLGCDAIRQGLYKGLDLWKPNIQAATTHDSFDASALGSFVESSLKARGSGALPPQQYLEIKLQRFDTANKTRLTFIEYGNTSSTYGAIGDGSFHAIGYNESGAEWIRWDDHTVATYNAGGLYSGTTGSEIVEYETGGPTATRGRTEHRFEVGTQPNPAALQTLTKLELERQSDGVVIQTFEGFEAWRLEHSNPDAIEGYREPICFYAFSEPGTFCVVTGGQAQMAFSWRRRDLGTGSWEIYVNHATGSLFAPGGGCQRYTSGSRNIAWIEGNKTAFYSAAGSLPLEKRTLCAGGTFPDAAFGATFRGSTNTTLTFEPITLDGWNSTFTGLNIPFFEVQNGPLIV